MDAGDTETLVRALALFTEIAQLTRLCIEGDFEPDEAPAGLVDLVCRAGDAPDIPTLAATVEAAGTEVRRIFERLVGRGGKGR